LTTKGFKNPKSSGKFISRNEIIPQKNNCFFLSKFDPKINFTQNKKLTQSKKAET
jgi:hypothetical protein